MTAKDHNDRLHSVEYLDDMHNAWRLIEELHKDGLHPARLVTRARTLYRQAWLDEKQRTRPC
jgi:hypothetical protein